MRLRGLVWGVVLSGAVLAGCVVQPSGRYQSDPNHYPYYRAVEEPPYPSQSKIRRRLGWPVKRIPNKS